MLVILQCLGGYFIEFSAFRIFLDLPVPYAAIEFGKPFSKSGELFSRETANRRAVENKFGLRLFPKVHRRQLVRARGQHPLNQESHVVVMVGKILRQPIQQVGIPSRLFHVIERLDQSAPKKSLPQAIDERAGQTRVLGVRAADRSSGFSAW